MAYTVFRVPVGYRLYDRERNKIVPLIKEEYEALNRLTQDDETKEDCEVLHLMQSHDYCRIGSLRSIEHPMTGMVALFLSEQVSNLTLQVTQNCNLRCSYCTYSGNYYNRQHNGSHMTLEIACRAVDFLFDHSTGVEEVIIGFYGGEPLLEFELIKKIINYIKNRYPARKVRYNLTTNLTLLSDEIIEYFIRKNVQLLISIDGPRKIQDKYRKFADGRGSYFTVVENAEKLRTKSTEYFQQCATNTVASPNEDYDVIREFLDTDQLFGPLNSMLTQLSDTGVMDEIQYSDDFYRVARKEKFKVLLEMLGEIDKTQISTVYARDKVPIIQMFQELKAGGTQNAVSAHPGGPCVPGHKKIFVDVHGNFYPCEKISEYEKYRIGNLDTGFDIDNIQKLMNVGKCTEKECLDCWAFLYCGTCAVGMIEGTELSREKRLKKCNDVLGGTLDRMADMETLKYYGYAFEDEA